MVVKKTVCLAAVFGCLIVIVCIYAYEVVISVFDTQKCDKLWSVTACVIDINDIVGLRLASFFASLYGTVFIIKCNIQFCHYACRWAVSLNMVHV